MCRGSDVPGLKTRPTGETIVHSFGSNRLEDFVKSASSPQSTFGIRSAVTRGARGERRPLDQPRGPGIPVAHQRSHAERARPRGPFACTPLSVRLFVVLGEQVSPEVTLEIAPHLVDVVGAVLGVVELDEERRTLDAVVVPCLASFG